MAGVKQLTDEFVATLKANAADDDQLFKWYVTASQRLGARAERLRGRVAEDMAAFVAAKSADWKAHRASAEARREANGEAEE